VREAAGQEGLAGALAGAVDRGADRASAAALPSAIDRGLDPAMTAALAGDVAGAVDPAVAEALAIVGDDRGVGTVAVLLYGDDVARALGWTPLGLGASAGLRHSIAAAADALRTASVADLFNRRWTPVP
jgi:hypothetical protein